MFLYTFFFEYDGGTYIAQVFAPSYDIAPKIWAENFDLHKKRGYKGLFERNFHKKLTESVISCEPISIENVSKTWYVSSSHLKRNTTIHFTETSSNV